MEAEADLQGRVAAQMQSEALLWKELWRSSVQGLDQSCKQFAMEGRAARRPLWGTRESAASPVVRTGAHLHAWRLASRASCCMPFPC